MRQKNKPSLAFYMGYSEAFNGKNYNSKNIITIDGIREKNKFGWWLIRASNTEEAIVVRFEGNYVEDKNELFNEVKYLLNNEWLALETI